MVDTFHPLTDSQGQVLRDVLPVQRRQRLWLRRVVDAIFYVCRSGCQWHNLRAAYPTLTVVYYHFYRFSKCQGHSLKYLLKACDSTQEYFFIRERMS
jgi:transposase